LDRRLTFGAFATAAGELVLDLQRGTTAWARKSDRHDENPHRQKSFVSFADNRASANSSSTEHRSHCELAPPEPQGYFTKSPRDLATDE
jgi:hypothetical protein